MIIVDNDVKKIAGLMLNIENNKLLFNERGELIKYHKGKNIPKYNKYKVEDVTCEFVVKMGIIITTKVRVNGLASSLTTTLDKYKTLSNRTMSTYSDQHTLVMEEVTYTDTTVNNTYRLSKRDIVTSGYDMRNGILNQYGDKIKFLWFIDSMDGPIFHKLKIEELCPFALSDYYLYRSISTIFVNNGIFNVSGIYKSLDYPGIEAYNAYKDRRIIKDPIIISSTAGLAYEIYHQFTGEDFVHTELPNDLMDCEFSNDFLRLKRRDSSKKWHSQLLEKFDYLQQEIDEKEMLEEGKPPFPDDVCFVTGIPLHDFFYVLTIKNQHSTFDIAVDPTVMHKNYLCGRGQNRNSFSDYLTYILDDVNVIEVKKAFNKNLSKLDVIESLDINPRKRKIMMLMETTGVYSVPYHYNYQGSENRIDCLIVLDPKSQIRYLGLPDIDVHMLTLFKNEQTVLFRYIPAAFISPTSPVIKQYLL